MARKLPVTLIFFIILLNLPSIPEAGCNCEIHSPKNQGLTVVPQNRPTSIALLDLQRNQITALHKSDFLRYNGISQLYLHCNNMISIEPGTFSNLLKLELLYLQCNNITKIHSETFSNLPKLDSLFLQYNQITKIEPGTFSKILKLRWLSLDGNKIAKIDSDTFSNVPKLRHLGLNKNQISVLSPSAYDMLSSISNVEIDNNPWQCDCRMVPFRKEMTGSRPFENQITCVYPDKFSGQKLKDINPEDLTCKESSMSTPPNTQALFTSSDVSASSSFGNAETTANPISSTSAMLPIDNCAQSSVHFFFTKTKSSASKTGYKLTIDTQWKKNMTVTRAPSVPLLAITGSNVNSYWNSETNPPLSTTILFGSLGGTVAGTVLTVTIILTIWYKRRFK